MVENTLLKYFLPFLIIESLAFVVGCYKEELRPQCSRDPWCKLPCEPPSEHSGDYGATSGCRKFIASDFGNSDELWSKYQYH